MIDVPGQRRARSSAVERARSHPADPEEALQRGLRPFRRRLLLTQAGAVAVLVTFAALATTVAATADDTDFARSVLVDMAQDAESDTESDTAPGASPQPGVSEAPTSRSGIVSIAITPDGAALPPGGTLAFAVRAGFEDGSTAPATAGVTWASGNPAVVGIGPLGVATARAPGTARVTARLGDASASVDITVDAVRILEGLRVEPVVTELCEVGSSQQLTVLGSFAGEPSGAEDEPGGLGLTQQVPPSTVAWTSSAPGVATVSPTGLVTRTSDEEFGVAVITAERDGVLGIAEVFCQQAIQGPVPGDPPPPDPPPDTDAPGGGVVIR